MPNLKCISSNDDLRFSNLSPSVSYTPPFTSIINTSTFGVSRFKPQYPSLSLGVVQRQSICFVYLPTQRMPTPATTTDAALCDFCRPLPVIASNLQSVRDIPYHKTFEDLQASALNGCVLCKWISENFPEYAFSKIHRLEYIARPEIQIFALMYEITDDEKERIREQIRQQPRQFPGLAVPVIGLDNLGMVFQTFYCNGRLSLS
jgi:hypothetical protein